MRINPEPKGPIRTVCNTVVKPMTAITAKTIHETWESFPPAPWTTISGNNTRVAMLRMAYCNAIPSAIAKEGLSSGW